MKKTTGLILCALFAALIAIGAWIQIPIGPVSVTLQTLFVLLAGMLLGAKVGAASCGVYLAVGLAGLPVFTKGGGMMYLLEPSFGYLVGFVVCAAFVGLATEKLRRLSFWSLFATAIGGILIVYAFGILYAWLILPLYVGNSAGLVALVTSGTLLFLPVDIISCAVCAWVVKKLKPRIGRYK